MRVCVCSCSVWKKVLAVAMGIMGIFVLDLDSGSFHSSLRSDEALYSRCTNIWISANGGVHVVLWFVKWSCVLCMEDVSPHNGSNSRAMYCRFRTDRLTNHSCPNTEPQSNSHQPTVLYQTLCVCVCVQCASANQHHPYSHKSHCPHKITSWQNAWWILTLLYFYMCCLCCYGAVFHFVRLDRCFKCTFCTVQ